MLRAVALRNRYRRELRIAALAALTALACTVVRAHDRWSGETGAPYVVLDARGWTATSAGRIEAGAVRAVRVWRTPLATPPGALVVYGPSTSSRPAEATAMLPGDDAVRGQR